MNAERILKLLRPYFEASQARWMLGGGFALAAWGSTRATADLDLIVDETARPALLSGAVDEGYTIVFDSDGFTNLLHDDPELGRLDFIWIHGETSRKMFAGAAERSGPGGLEVLVPKPEHLVAMKVRAIQARPTRVFRDAPDLELLLGLPGVNHNEIRGYFERAGLRELYDRLQGEREER